MTKINHSMAISAPKTIVPLLVNEINNWGRTHYDRPLVNMSDVYFDSPISQIVVRFDTEEELSLFCLQFKRSYE
mgnify:CR=1 FL=1